MVTVGYRTESIYRQYSIADSKLLEEATVELAALQSERDRRDRRVCGRVAERGIRPMHYEDAMKFLIEKLAGSPNIFADASRLPNFDVFIPSAITGFPAPSG